MPPARELGYTEKNHPVYYFCSLPGSLGTLERKKVVVTILYIFFAAYPGAWVHLKEGGCKPSCILFLQPAWELMYTGKKMVVIILYSIVDSLKAWVHGEEGGFSHPVILLLQPA